MVPDALGEEPGENVDVCLTLDVGVDAVPDAVDHADATAVPDPVDVVEREENPVGVVFVLDRPLALLEISEATTLPFRPLGF